jgi:diguanylate cyclase (GGDEF)-like protein/PAS domain S-box-containing protein
MSRWYTLHIKNEILFWFLFLAVLPLLIIVSLNYYFQKTNYLEKAQKDVNLVLEYKLKDINDYLSSIKKDLNMKSQTTDIHDILIDYEKNFSAEKKRFYPKEFSRKFMSFVLREGELYDIFLISLSGDIIYSVKQEDDLGTNLLSGKYANSNLAKVFQSTLGIYDTAFSDFEYYAPSNEAGAFIAVPVYNNSKIIGVLAAQIDTKKLYSQFSNVKGLGQSGEIFGAKLEENSIIATTPLLHHPNPTKGSFVFKNEKNSAIYQAIRGERKSGIVINYKGEESVAAWGYLPQLEWGVVAQTNLDEILQPIEELRLYSIMLLFFVVLGIVIAILSSIKRIVEPIEKLTRGMQTFSISKRNEPIELDVENEIGELAKNFNEMANTLKQSQITIEKYANELEQKVEQRTQELQEAKDDIEHKSIDMSKYIELIDKYIITSATDTEGVITDVSDAFCQISGYSKEELIGKNHNILRHPEMPQELYEDMWSTITSGKIWRGEVKNLKKDGSSYWVHAIIEPKYNEDKTIKGYYAIRQDITDKKIIEEISITDGLTNIYNRRHFNDTFPKVINSAKRKDELVSFLLMDIDHFKQYNDNYGHQMGDDVLRAFAACLKSSLHRADDIAFRLGGEEFGIIYKTDTKEKALEFADNLRQEIKNLNLSHNYTSLEDKVITASMGLVCKNASMIKDMDEVFKQADDLLYQSKESGRDRVSINAV